MTLQPSSVVLLVVAGTAPLTLPEATAFLAAAAAMSGVVYNMWIAHRKEVARRNSSSIEERSSSFSEAITIIRELREDKLGLQNDIGRLERRVQRLERQKRTLVEALSRSWRTPPELVEQRLHIDVPEDDADDAYDDDNTARDNDRSRDRDKSR